MTILLGQLLHSPAYIFRQLMINYGLATASGDWPVTADTELNLPDNALVVTNTEGERWGRIQVTGEQPEHFGVQVKIRSSLPQVGWTKANLIAVAMDQQLSYQSVTIDSSVYAVGAITRKSSVLSIGREAGASKRFLFTVNAVFVVEQMS